MKAQMVVYALILLIAPINVSAQGNQVKINSQAQSKIDSLTSKLSDGKILMIEILQMPPELLTFTRITPDMLEKQFHYKFIIRDIRGEVLKSKLIEALKSIKVQSRSELSDLRWGLIFYGLDGNRVCGLYFDKIGKSGAVGNVPVSFKGNIFKWLEDNFSKCFR